MGHATTASVAPKSESSSQSKKIRDYKETHTAELVISLCGFIGTKMDDVSKILHNIFENEYGYVCEQKKLSEYIKTYSSKASDKELEGISRFQRYNKLIDGGNELRGKHGEDVLVKLVIQEIHFDRDKERAKKEQELFSSRKKCYIINSIKNQKELELLRDLYGGIHYCFGIFSPIPMREINLKKEGIEETELKDLMNRDSGEEVHFGQTVGDTFTQADFFLRMDSSSEDYLKNKIERFINLIFSAKVITPTCDETAMYLAASAAGNSACLSKQVGAALTDKEGEVISVGWNDVPKFGGDLYKSEVEDLLKKRDRRCFNLGEGCWNDAEKNTISNDLIEIIKKAIADQKIDPDTIDWEKVFTKIRFSKIKSLLEFSRAIHAEMHAIIIGSQIAGEKVKKGRLYITTYPCHICARHIIVAGIEKVYYIEPYRKSLTMRLHNDAITENESEPNKVRLLMFEGVAPNRYMQLFKMSPGNRKLDDGSGKMVTKKSRELVPKHTLSLEAIPVLESAIAEEMNIKGLGGEK